MMTGPLPFRGGFFVIRLNPLNPPNPPNLRGLFGVNSLCDLVFKKDSGQSVASGSKSMIH